jgi:glutamate synthase (NADPH/NADH) large chain
LGWKTTDILSIREIAKSGSDPIGSLGYDSPLEALTTGSVQNLPDYFKEQVAVVTNPAIDREREAAHFSTRTYVGSRPTLRGPVQAAVELKVPLLLGGQRVDTESAAMDTAREHGTCTLEALLAHLTGRARILSCSLGAGETIRQALERLKGEALAAVARGCRLLLLDDSRAFSPSRSFLDPSLAVAVLHKSLMEAIAADGESLRRRTSLVVRSGALRNLHDLIFALGMGADALCPYLIWELADREEGGPGNLMGVLQAGLEKVISTMGTHEIGGYGKYFASIGLSSELAEIFATPNFYGSAGKGLTLARLEQDNRARGAVARSSKNSPWNAVPPYPRI